AGRPTEALLGSSVTDLIRDIVVPQDRKGLDIARRYGAGGPEPYREAGVRCLDAEGLQRQVHITWSPGAAPHERLVLLLDAEPEAFSRQVSDTLTRAAGQLSECGSEVQVLERAVGALAAHSF